MCLPSACCLLTTCFCLHNHACMCPCLHNNVCMCLSMLECASACVTVHEMLQCLHLYLGCIRCLMGSMYSLYTACLMETCTACLMGSVYCRPDGDMYCLPDGVHILPMYCLPDGDMYCLPGGDMYCRPDGCLPDGICNHGCINLSLYYYTCTCLQVGKAAAPSEILEDL